MNILIDTNIFIHLEDYKIVDDSFTKLYNILNRFNHKLLVHPSSLEDINKDKNQRRKNISLSKFKKYTKLQKPPIPSLDDILELGLNEKNDHDRIDNIILFALYKNTVNILLTQDQGIIKKARKLGIDHRVMYVQQALHSFNKLHLQHEVYYPEMTKKFLHELNINDNIFDSLRDDYSEFDSWFIKVSQEQRQCWVHGCSNDIKISGILIYKEEKDPIITNDDKALKGKVLKISTFKITEQKQGLKLGELFLKTIFTYTNKNNYKYIYLTTKKSKQPYLISLIEDFGFYYYGTCEKNRDDVYIKEIKRQKNTIIDNISNLEYYKKYSPSIKCENNTNKFIIPIKPEFHNILFPELEDNKRLIYINQSVGNTIKKAYLSHANTKQMKEGDLVLFYRSKDKKAITTLGIVEKTFKSDNLDIILEEVTKRTVYSYDDIEEMSKKETNIILFRLIEQFDKPFITKKWLEEKDIYKNCQSICKIEDDTFSKILKQAKLNYCIDGEAN